MRATPLRWVKGGEAWVLSVEGDRISVRSTTASAPGSRPEGSIASGAKFWMKVARCRRDGDGFLIEGRLLDATRDTRAEIERLAGTSADDPLGG